MTSDEQSNATSPKSSLPPENRPANRPEQGLNEALDFIALSQEHPIVFFDGVCGLCNTVVDWIMVQDKTAKFLFSPLQGESASRALKTQDASTIKTVIVLNKGRYYKHSRAVVEILLELPGWKLAGWTLWLIPSPLRDLGYKIVSKLRYLIWGQKSVCRIPTAEERKLFLL